MRVLGTLCQDLGTETKYIFSVIPQYLFNLKKKKKKKNKNYVNPVISPFPLLLEELIVKIKETSFKMEPGSPEGGTPTCATP